MFDIRNPDMMYIVKFCAEVEERKDKACSITFFSCFRGELSFKKVTAFKQTSDMGTRQYLDN